MGMVGFQEVVLSLCVLREYISCLGICVYLQICEIFFTPTPGSVKCKITMWRSYFTELPDRQLDGLSRAHRLQKLTP